MLKKIFNRKVLGGLALDILTGLQRLHKHLVEYQQIKNHSFFGVANERIASLAAVPKHGFFFILTGTFGLVAAVPLNVSGIVENPGPGFLAAMAIGSHFILSSAAMKLHDKINSIAGRSLDVVAYPATNKALDDIKHGPA